MSFKSWNKQRNETITKKIKEIMNNAEIQNHTIITPTSKMRKDIRFLILDFIKENKRIVYGGTAINHWITLKNKKDNIYGDELLAGDIEFYSPKPVNDIIKLCNIFKEHGFRNIEGKEAQHPETYSIFVEYVNFCDITYVHSSIMNNNIPAKKHDGILYAEPSFIITDFYRKFSNILYDNWRLDKDFKRFVKLEKYYFSPPKKTSFPSNNFICPPSSDIFINKSIDENKDTLHEIQNYIYKNFILNQTSIILTGTFAYLYYIHKSKYHEKDKNIYCPTNQHYELINKTPIPLVKCFIQKLKSTFGDHFTIDEYIKFFQFYDNRFVILYKNIPVLTVYGNNNKCIPYHTMSEENDKSSKKDILQICSIQYLYQFLYGHLSKYNKVRNNCYKHYNCMIYYLSFAKNHYLKKNKLIGTEEGLFNEFLFDCKWLQSSSKAEQGKRYDKWKKGKKNKKKSFHWKYNPHKDKIKPTIEKIFTNASGNRVFKLKNRKIKTYLPEDIK